jgi:hypothetical protein
MGLLEHQHRQGGDVVGCDQLLSRRREQHCREDTLMPAPNVTDEIYAH